MDRARSGRKQALPFAVAIGFATLGGLGLWYFGAPTERVLENAGPANRPADGAGLAASDRERCESVALRYAEAIRTADCDTVIGLTWWMQERLEFIRGGADQPDAAVEKAREALCEGIRDAIGGEPVLRAEGIEDGHVFTRHARFAVEGVTRAREDLAKPALAEVWMRIEYPNPGGAPRNAGGRPVKAMRVGVNVSADGYVLKAGVVGNLDVDYDSIAYHW